MVVLGIDPGLATTGYGVVAEAGGDLQLITYGTFTTRAGDPLAARLQQIYRDLQAIVAEYKPTAAAVEEIFFAKNARTAFAVGQARGVVLLALADAGLWPVEYTPLQVKEAVVGYGRATKDQVQAMVKVLLGLDAVPQPDDAADALAVAICHLHSHAFQNLACEG